jgi:hypothetical protein
MTEHSTPPVPETPEAADETRPEITRVLHALAAEQHANLCNCNAYPDTCVSPSRYDQNRMLANLTYAEPALEEALKQGWTPPPTDTPPVAGEIPEAAVKGVAEAIEAAYRRGCLNWNAEARAAISAYRPHLTAERDAETTALREGVQQIAWGLRLAGADFTKEFGNGPSNTRDVLGRVLDLATSLASPVPAEAHRALVKEQEETAHLRARDAETAALRAENEKLAELWHEVVDHPEENGERQIWLRRWMTSASSILDDPDEYADSWWVNAERVHEVIHAYLVANNLPLPAVLADPAPSAPTAQENQT